MPLYNPQAGAPRAGEPPSWVRPGPAHQSRLRRLLFQHRERAAQYLASHRRRAGDVTTLGALIETAGVTTGTGVNELALYSEAGTLLAVTGDMTTAFESTDTPRAPSPTRAASPATT